MKLRDLARSSGDPKSFIPAFHLLRSRFRSQETSRRSRKSYESVHTMSSTPFLLTFLLQQTIVVIVLGTLCRPCHPGSRVKFPIRTYHRDQYVRKRTCYRPAFLHFLILEQNQRKTYREVLIAGDLSQENVNQVTIRFEEYKVSRAVNEFKSACSDTLPRTFPKRGPCSHMVEARLTPLSSFTATTPSTSPNLVCPSLSLAGLGLELSIYRSWPGQRIPQTTLFR